MSNETLRRDLLKYMAAGTASVSLSAYGAAKPAWALKPAKTVALKKSIPVGVQLWSVRDECTKDFDATLAAVAKMGFQGVEFAGYHKYKEDAVGLRKKLDELGLKAAGTHIGAKFFEGDELKKTIEFHKTIGCSLLIVPGDGRFSDPEGSKKYAEVMNKAAEVLKPAGLACGHHNHTEEFKKVAGANGAKETTYWNLFADRTSKDVFLEMDIGWVREAGLDPVELMTRYPGRIRTVHIKAKPEKDKGKFIVGQDKYDWKRVLTACYQVGGTEWFLVEQEDYPDGKTPLQATKASLDGLTKILKGMPKTT